MSREHSNHEKLLRTLRLETKLSETVIDGLLQEARQSRPRTPITPSIPSATIEWLRAKAEWCGAVIDHFQMKHAIVEIAISILSRYIQSESIRELPSDHVDRCSTAAALRIAMMHHSEDHFMPLEELVKMGHMQYTGDEICESEWHIIRCVGHDATKAPTTESFAKGFVSFLETPESGPMIDIRETIERLSRPAIHDVMFLEIPMQWVGLGIVVLAFRLCRPEVWKGHVDVIYQTVGIREDSTAASHVTCVSYQLRNSLDVKEKKDDTKISALQAI